MTRKPRQRGSRLSTFTETFVTCFDKSLSVGERRSYREIWIRLTGVHLHFSGVRKKVKPTFSPPPPLPEPLVPYSRRDQVAKHGSWARRRTPSGRPLTPPSPLMREARPAPNSTSASTTAPLRAWPLRGPWKVRVFAARFIGARVIVLSRVSLE